MDEEQRRGLVAEMKAMDSDDVREVAKEIGAMMSLPRPNSPDIPRHPRLRRPVARVFALVRRDLRGHPPRW